MKYIVYYVDGNPRHPGVAYEGKSYYKACKILNSYQKAYADVWIVEIDDEE